MVKRKSCKCGNRVLLVLYGVERVGMGERGLEYHTEAILPDRSCNSYSRGGQDRRCARERRYGSIFDHAAHIWRATNSALSPTLIHQYL